MAQEVRVRFAPSPTGEPHIGNVRTALFNWLYARRLGGKFVVRVEDTDRQRFVEGATEAVLDSLRWLGLDWDEGPEVGGPFAPYFQSQRLQLYRDAAARLVESDNAYPCYCSRSRLEEMRAEQQEESQTTGYDRRCRDLSAGECRDHEAQGIVPVVRFKMPLSGTTTVHDLIRGEVTWQNQLLDDLIVVKSDGYPTYHLANVVDDHLMEISHVLRAEEWLPSSPRHVLIYRALGYEPPQFAHLPMILGPDRSKLSKRHGATSVLEYRDAGYLPEAMVNFLSLLGWSLDDKTDIISRDDLIANISLERIGKSGAIFDGEKLLWMNGAYIRQMGEDELADKLVPFLEAEFADGTHGLEREYVRRIVPLVRERLTTLGEAPRSLSYFFQDSVVYERELLMQKGMDEERTIAGLGRARDVIKELGEFDSSSIEGALRSTAQELGLSGRQLFGALRVAVTGRTAAPPLFETMDVLGKVRCLERIDDAAGFLASLK